MTQEKFIFTTIDKKDKFKDVTQIFGYHGENDELMLVEAIIKKKGVD